MKRHVIRLLSVIMLVIALPERLSSQSIRIVSNADKPYRYFVPESMSLSEAKKAAIEAAKTEILREEFGERIDEYIIDLIAKDKEHYTALASTLVMGEWIQDIKEPDLTTTFEDNHIVITVQIKGKARKINTTGTLFKAKTVRGNANGFSESSSFKDGENLYLTFESPTDGYIAVYMLDTQHTAYCLLPYRSASDGKTAVKANTLYTFFSKENAQPMFEQRDVDSYKLLCDEGSETMFLYILFSPNPFIKASDSKTESYYTYELPRSLSDLDFFKWLSRKRILDKEMQQVIKAITITK